MRPRSVVIVAYPDMQSLDAVGPFEVFSLAAKVAEARGRGGCYQPVLASAAGAGRLAPRAGCSWSPPRWPKPRGE